MHRVVVPQLFENMEEATIGQWLVSPGQSVAKDQPLCELITEKVTLELPAETEGTVRQLVAPDKAIVPTGFVIALIGDATEALPDVTAENAKLKFSETVAPHPMSAPAREDITAATPPASADSPADSPAGSGANSGTRLRATPAARRAAKVVGVTLEDVAVQFPDKVLSEDDVKAFAAGAAGEAK